MIKIIINNKNDIKIIDNDNIMTYDYFTRQGGCNYEIVCRKGL